jgi:hydrogenase-1 operon protein HyaF
MAWSVMTEIGPLLEALAATGEPGSIDLRSLPLTEADRDELERLLGRGEVQAELEVAGSSEVWETGYPGAWWVRHRGAGGKVASEEIAVCRVPDILMTHPVDIEAAAQRIRETLDASPSEGGPSEPELEASHV